MHANTADSTSKSGNVYRIQGKLDEALNLNKQNPEKQRAMHGSGKAHTAIASSLYCLALVYEDRCNFDEAAQLYEQCLEMDRRIHAADSVRPDIGQCASKSRKT